MPRKARELSALEVKRLRHPGHGGNKTVAVGGVDGLLLQITPSGARSWILRVTIGELRRHLGLGAFPSVTLACARELARDARAKIKEGIDPIEEKKAKFQELAHAQKRGLTFRDAMESYLPRKLSEFDNEKHRRQWRSSLDRYAIPEIGDLFVSDINVHDIQRTLEPIWYTKTETAVRLRGRIEAVISWAIVAGYRSGDNPARWHGNLDAILPKPSKISDSGHHPALRLEDAAAWFSDVRGRTGVATRALEFMALTAARSGEVRGAHWNEIDFEKRIWTIPAARMKARSEHRIALPDEALDLLGRLDRMAGNPLIFPAVRGGCLSDAALSACMKRINAARVGGYTDRKTERPAVPHGLRSTFRDWAAELTEYPREIAEISLSHKVGSEVERAYRRSDMLEKRRSMMNDWALFLIGRC